MSDERENFDPLVPGAQCRVELGGVHGTTWWRWKKSGKLDGLLTEFNGRDAMRRSKLEKLKDEGFAV